jgi:hypothetical protein
MLEACTDKDGLTLTALLNSLDDITLPPSPVEVGMRMLRLADINHHVPPDYASIIRAVETEGHRRCTREAIYHIGRNPPELHVGERAHILCDPIVIRTAGCRSCRTSCVANGTAGPSMSSTWVTVSCSVPTSTSSSSTEPAHAAGRIKRSARHTARPRAG